MADEKKTQTLLIAPGNLDMDQIIEGLEVECLFKSISDGGSKNQATFDIEGYRHKFTVNGVTIGQVILGLAMGEVRIKHAGKVRKMTAADARATNGQSTELADLIARAARAETDPMTQGLRAFGKMTPEQQDELVAKILGLQAAAKAKMAGIVADTAAVLAAEIPKK